MQLDPRVDLFLPYCFPRRCRGCAGCRHCPGVSRSASLVGRGKRHAGTILSQRADEAEAARALERVGLGERLHHFPSQLSGGEKQRVALVRAPINQLKLILADEPTGNLDEANERLVLDLRQNLHAAGHTILLVTHSPTIGRMAHTRVELAHGRLAQIVLNVD